MTEARTGLVPFEVSSQIARLKEGGLIAGAVGGPQKNMDVMIGVHLDRIAALQARGDKVPERPMYIFNPDSRLLINYAMRRNDSPARSGLFAEVVELDEEGRPRQGIGVVNPFQTKTGFMQVEVGDNPYGFAPSRIDLELDSDDPLQMVPPNMDTAVLLAMLKTEPIPEGETFKDFLERINKVKEEQIQRATEVRTKRYPGTTQGLTERTNVYVHLIVSDRDPAFLAEASRSVGLFPIVASVDEIINRYSYLMHSIDQGPFIMEKYLRTIYRLRGEDLGDQSTGVPAFITLDYPESSLLDQETGRLRTIPSPELDDSRIRPFRNTTFEEITNRLVLNNPVFAVAKSICLEDIREKDLDSDILKRYHITEEELKAQLKGAQTVDKVGHGNYRQVINPNDPVGMQNYTDWLRKVHLDLALTHYLRGLNQL